LIKLIRQKLYRIKKHYWPKTIILCYHRIGDYLSDPYDITVSNKNFISQIQWLIKYFNLISLDDLYECLQEQKYPYKKSVLLTFDDGYASTSNTIQLLEKWSIPATFFICTPDNDNRHFYWDILSHLLIEQKTIPDDDMDFIIHLCKIAHINLIPEKKLDDNGFNIGLKWKRHDNNYITQRCEVLELLTNNAEYEHPNSPNSILNLLNQKSFPIESDRSILSGINKLDIAHCTIGAHTMNHYSLSSLHRNEQKNEILNNKKQLENELGVQIKYFAYPFGSKRHYNPDSINIVQDNFSLALSNRSGLINKESNSYELPRFLVRDWDLKEFKNKVNIFFQHV